MGRACNEILNQASTESITFSENEKEIKIWYYYDDVDSFDCEKAVSFLKTFLIATKFEKRNCFINLTVVVFHSSFNYGELVCNKSYNFATRFDVTKM